MPGSKADPRMNLEERTRSFWRLVDTSGGAEACWPWLGTIANGYGRLEFLKRRVMAHRLAYELVVGAIPAGLQLDHLCHSSDLLCPGGECLHRRCVNPAHLEPVTNQENVRRGRGPAVTKARYQVVTHCPNGHEYTADNVYRAPSMDGRRRCIRCQREASRRSVRNHRDAIASYNRQYYARKKAERQLARTRAAMADLTLDELIDLTPDYLETAGADQA